MVSVVVRGRIPGREGMEDVLLDVEPTPTARELIGAVVAAQLAAQVPAAWPDCSRLYLTDSEIAAMAARGTIRLGGTTLVAPPPTVAKAIAQAVRAFERGVFAMFAGAAQIRGIDEAVKLQDGDRVVFLRLTALAGG